MNELNHKIVGEKKKKNFRKFNFSNFYFKKFSKGNYLSLKVEYLKIFPLLVSDFVFCVLLATNFCIIGHLLL